MPNVDAEVVNIADLHEASESTHIEVFTSS